MVTTYTSYLQLNKILNAQQPLSQRDHDEHLFITIHQTYELWFKQILYESQKLNITLQKYNLEDSTKTLCRILKILKVLIHQVDILETMSPLSFASFRDRLGQASGFQSVQFRMLEFTIGYKNKNVFSKLDKNDSHYKQLLDLVNQPTLYDNLIQFLSQGEKVTLPKELLQRNYSNRHQYCKELETLFYSIYKEHSSYPALLELFIDLDEGFQEWRYRHLKMVERTIGAKIGTGGSTGATYLTKHLFDPVFPELWSVRRLF